ncbi:Hypothetical protein [Arabidopsis thaliana]|uniref:Uncharacterized protein F20D21.3 n=1 Tax=Arabidopsis thaliana TaxID=3702 RepID=Q9SLL1_ARATH|nr:Hypothetical protein [Arabidopsis thaliana]
MLLADLEEQKKGKYVLIRDDAEDSELGQFYKPLPCFGFGIGWFSIRLPVCVVRFDILCCTCDHRACASFSFFLIDPQETEKRMELRVEALTIRICIASMSCCLNHHLIIINYFIKAAPWNLTSKHCGKKPFKGL